jgi:hypothetical protein
MIHTNISHKNMRYIIGVLIESINCFVFFLTSFFSYSLFFSKNLYYYRESEYIVIPYYSEYIVNGSFCAEHSIIETDSKKT